MLRRLSMIALLSAAPIWTAGMAQSQIVNAVDIAIGKPGSESFVFGTELWALAQIALKPSQGISLETIEAAEESERLALLRDGRAEIALVHGQIPTPDTDNMRTVMTLWPEGRADGEATPAQLIARKDVADEVIYRLTKAIYDNTNFFRNARATLGVAPVDQAVAGAALLVHPGAYRYYHEEGPDAGTGKLAIYDNFDDTALDHAERSQIAAACRQALDLGSLSAVLGDLSFRGCEVYQAYLADQEGRQQQKSAAGSQLFSLPGGRGGPAIAVDDVSQSAPVMVKDSPVFKPNSRQPTM